jgi:putative MATE family efflux protein
MATTTALPESPKARFLSGSIMRHVVVMTMTGGMGLMFMFLVDAATLFWVSYLGVEHYVAAMGFAFTIQFFTISVGIGLMIAATALVARSLGQDNLEQARRQTTSSAIYAVTLQTIVSVLVVIFREPLLSSIGATGETLDVAARFLMISVSSLPFMALGMIGSAVLRAQGDAWRSMAVTMSAGIVAMIVDPLLIIGFGLGVDGAAIGVVISRCFSAGLSVWFIVRVHNLAGSITKADLAAIFKPFVFIAIPALATQLATPFGNAIVTRLISGYGDAAVAGFAVIARLSVLAFGGLFALSGAIGGIIGQNYGAGLFDRVRAAYRDALIFCTIYTVIVWLILILATQLIIDLFKIGPDAAAVLRAFTTIAAGGYIFTGGLFAANAAFNNLGKPVYSTLVNWLRDGIFLYPVLLIGAAQYGASGIIYGQAAASIIVGTIAIYWGWRFVVRMEEDHKLAPKT